MVFSSLFFLYAFLPASLFVYALCPTMKSKNISLLVFSLFFYAWGEPKYVLLLAAMAFFDWFFALRIDGTDDAKKRKFWLTMACVVDLGLIGWFKYSGMIASVFGEPPAFIANIALPIGISFYTFQSMSYPIDVYRHDAEIQHNYINFGAFVSLFPQLIAGPIVRYKDIASQLDKRPHNLDHFGSGVERFMQGLAKKVLLANGIGSLWDVYAAAGPGELTVVGAWLGAVTFSLQIYYDFSGYSDMAIGLGRMFGFDFLENFNYPYVSKSVTEFWRRWHMSLGTWFRDYVYIPLGGNRRGLARQILNIAVVWGLTGFWLGANWTFLLWGLYYAVFLIIEKLFLLRRLEKLPAFGHVYAVIVAVFGWMIFQLETVSEVVVYYAAMLGIRSAGFIAASDIFYLTSYLPLLVVSLLAATPVLKKLYFRVPENVRRYTTPALVVAALLVCTAKLTNDTYNPFLYFRF